MYCLLIDRDEHEAALRATALRELGHVTIWVPDSLTATDVFAAWLPDAIVSSCAESEDVEAMRRWRAAGLTLPVIVETSSRDARLNIACLDAGADLRRLARPRAG